MKGRILHLALAAALESMQHIPQELKTTGHKLSSSIKGYTKTKSSSRNWRPKRVSKYTSHQGKQECARRLKVQSPAWYSAQTFVV